MNVLETTIRNYSDASLLPQSAQGPARTLSAYLHRNDGVNSKYQRIQGRSGQRAFQSQHLHSHEGLRALSPQTQLTPSRRL